jgi:TPR repeat protein
MKISRTLLAVTIFPFVSFGDVPPKARVPSVIRTGSDQTKRQREESKENYRRGVQLADGDGVEKDYTAAVEFYRKAAEAGYAPAQYDLGYAYEQGLGIECDFREAAIWYRKAAEQGDPEAQNNLGALYATGRGVARSDQEAIRWYRLAADQNDPEATSNLASMYRGGRAVERDLVTRSSCTANPPNWVMRWRRTILL